MKLAFIVVASSCLGAHKVSAFMTTPRPVVIMAHLPAFPDVNQVATDGFMKQLGHASQLIPLLHPQDGKALSDDETNYLRDVLFRQLSHSDGIRGFFATYLTSPELLTVDHVPEVLAEAVTNSDTKTMVPLACMNVIMPTAMSSMHQDAELRESAHTTTINGLKILRLLRGNEEVVRNCRAIMIVCQGTGEGPEDEFFEVMIQVSFHAYLGAS